MYYSLTPVPVNLGTIHFLLEDMYEEVQYPHDSTYIQYGNALFHALSALISTHTFGDISLNVLDHMVAHRNLIFSINRYMPNTIKSSERQCQCIFQRLILGGAATRRPDDFKVFLGNEDIKIQLAELMLKVWSSPVAASRLEKCKEAMLIVEGRVYKLTSSDGEISTT